MSAAALYRALAAREFRSGEDLARELHVSRSAIWKGVQSLRALGAEIHAVPNRGYRLRSGAPLDAEHIRAAMTALSRERLVALDVQWSLESTNAALLERPQLLPGRASVLLAEHQTAGRGRRGRTWIAPLGGAVCLSIGWTFPQLPADLSAVSLAVGVSTLRALHRLGIGVVRLKWPNDLVTQEGKLGGILTELRAEAGGAASIVVGLGLNVSLGPAVLEQIAATGTSATDLTHALRGSSGRSDAPPDRNAIAGACVDAIVRGLLEFQSAGFKPFVEDWRKADALRGRTVTVIAGEERTIGVARGVDLSGALMLETPRGATRCIAGEVSVRPNE